MTVEKITINFEEIEIIGATLLTIEEIEKLSIEERCYDSWWWLRSQGNHSSYVAYVEYDGNIRYDGDTVDDYNGFVRPALLISNLKSTNFKIGDIFRIGGYEFKIISEKLAWLYNQDIGQFNFRDDYEANNANDYNNSNIKHFVEKWFENFIKS